MQSGRNVGEDTEQIVNEINAVAPQLLLVYAIRHRRQEKFLAQHRTDAECAALVRCRQQRIHLSMERRNRRDSARDCWRGIK